MLGRTPNITVFNDTVVMYTTVLQNDIDNATFSIAAFDFAGNSLNVSQHDLNSTNVLIDNVSPYSTILTINSTNPNTSYAKTTDTITVTLIANEILSNATSVILGRNSNVMLSNNIVITNMSIMDGDDGNATFAIIISDLAGNMHSVTESDLDSDNIIIDTIAPSKINLTISNNFNSAMATTGNILNITLETNEIIVDATATILNRPANYIIQNDTVYASTTVQKNDPNENTTFAISVFDPSGNYLSVTKSDLDSNNIIIDTIAPSITNLMLSSNNANSTRATLDDIVTITLETNETLAGANITALNGTFQMITENDTVTINLPVPANHPTGNATFNITARDAQNNILYVTDANLTSGYVFVDTIKPNLTINGNDVIIVELYSEYVENGASVTDEDPAYNNTITSNTSAVNSRIPGTYLIEYMAQPDPAGNVPETATRTVSVTDTKIPYLEMLNITSDNANNTRATINDILTITLETNETLAGANITALNGTFQMITENDTVTINLPVPANHPTGNATFNITARDAQNNILYVTDANLTSGYVFVDTIKPNLTINGNDVIIVELYSEYVENGASVTDEDPAYNNTITSNTSAVNSRIPGTYLIEYMAQPDPAGNVPETATRTVSVTDTKIPYLEMLNITSDNANNTRATINDILTITLETNETLAGANITALNGTFQMITENDTVTINLPVPANHPTGNATFNITARDAQNNILYVTDANLTSGYVFVDTIKPNLTINGNDVIVELYSEYVENGASVTDEDPAYNNTITSNTSAVNSRIPGTYLIEYMAQPDPAGNVPETATRTVSVTYKILFCASRAVMLNVALPVG